MSDLDLMIDAYARGQKLAADLELDGMLDAEAIRRMDMREYRARRIRAGLADIDPFAGTSEPAPVPAAQDPAGVMAAQHPEHATEDPGLDFQRMSMDDYAALRGRLGIGQGRQEGVGIFNAASRQAQLDATRAQLGRTALSNANVVEPPRLTGRQERQGDRIDNRSARERFATPGNSWQG